MDNKIIKEMAKDISEHLHGVFRIEIDTLAEALVNAGYRKIDEDAVVLTRERYSVLTELECKKERYCKELEQTIRKETVEKFAERLKEMAYQSNDWSHGEHPMVVEIDYIDEICKELTGELKWILK